jgi:hypothetical protein
MMTKCPTFQEDTSYRIKYFITVIKLSPFQVSASNCKGMGLIPGQCMWDCAQCDNEIDFPVKT